MQVFITKEAYLTIDYSVYTKMIENLEEMFDPRSNEFMDLFHRGTTLGVSDIDLFYRGEVLDIINDYTEIDPKVFDSVDYINFRMKND